MTELATTIVETTKGYNACLCQRHAELFPKRMDLDRCEEGPCEMCLEDMALTIAAADWFVRDCS